MGTLTEALSNASGANLNNYAYTATASACPTCGKCPTCGSYRTPYPYVYGWPYWNQLPQQTWMKAQSNAQVPPTTYPMNVTWYNVSDASGSSALPASNNASTNTLNQSYTLHSLDANASPPR